MQHGKMMKRIMVLLVAAMFVCNTAAFAEDIILLEDDSAAAKTVIEEASEVIVIDKGTQAAPTVLPTSVPTAAATPQATQAATQTPIATKTPEATAQATAEATAEATAQATAEATAQATAEATAQATAEATAEVTKAVVTFLDAEGKIAYKMTVKANAAFTAPDDLVIEKDGCVLKGWLRKNAETGKKFRFDFKLGVTEDVTLYPYMVALKAQQEEPAISAEEEQAEQEPAVEQKEATDDETEEAADEAAEQPEVTEETKDVIADEEAEQAQQDKQQELAPNIKVSVMSSAQGEVKAGDAIMLYAIVSGAQDVAYEVVWQYNNGTEWKDAQQGGSTLSFVLTEENYHWSWRVKVMVNQPDVQA